MLINDGYLGNEKKIIGKTMNRGGWSLVTYPLRS
jgi:hypothetical protein